MNFLRRASLKISETSGMKFVDVNTELNTVVINNETIHVSELQLDNPIKGTVYGTLLNYKGALEKLGEAVNEKPYNAPPIAPVLYIKPINTFNYHGAEIVMPEGISKLEMGAALGLVIGRQASAVDEATALTYVAGYTIVNDVSVPHESVFRPAVQHKARDGFCPIGPWIINRDEIEYPDNLAIRVFINDQLQQKNSTSNTIRPVSRLLADVTEFMTLYPGDVLLVGVPEEAPLAVVGDKIRVEIAGIGSLENIIVSEIESKQRRAI